MIGLPGALLLFIGSPLWVQTVAVIVLSVIHYAQVERARQDAWLRQIERDMKGEP